MAPGQIQNRRAYSFKDKMLIMLESEAGHVGCKSVARQCRVQACQLRAWKNNRESVLTIAASIKDTTAKQQFVMEKMMHKGRTPSMEMSELV
jgi:hypothetical protein